MRIIAGGVRKAFAAAGVMSALAVVMPSTASAAVSVGVGVATPPVPAGVAWYGPAPCYYYPAYCGYPVYNYAGPVFADGGWYYGPHYYGWWGGRPYVWFHGGWYGGYRGGWRWR